MPVGTIHTLQTKDLTLADFVWANARLFGHLYNRAPSHDLETYKEAFRRNKLEVTRLEKELQAVLSRTDKVWQEYLDGQERMLDEATTGSKKDLETVVKMREQVTKWIPEKPYIELRNHMLKTLNDEADMGTLNLRRERMTLEEYRESTIGFLSRMLNSAIQESSRLEANAIKAHVWVSRLLELFPYSETEIGPPHHR